MNEIEKVLKKLTPIEKGPCVLVSEALTRVRPLGFAARWVGWRGSEKAKGLEAVGNFYEESVAEVVLWVLNELMEIHDSTDYKKAAAGMAKRLTAREEVTVVGATLRATILHVIGDGPAPDLALIAAERWDRRAVVDPIALFAAESASDNPAGSGGGPFTVDDSIMGAIADSFNGLIQGGHFSDWRARARARVESEELTRMLAPVPRARGAPHTTRSGAL